MGPQAAAELFLRENPDAERFVVTLYGSLAETGKGHLSDRAILDALGEERTEVVFDREKHDLPHPNTMVFRAFRGGAECARMEALSIGGGAVKIVGRPDTESPEVYSETSFSEIAEICRKEKLRLYEYAILCESPDFFDRMRTIWEQMKASVYAGLSKRGTLPGGLNVERKAGILYSQHRIDESPVTRENRILCSYAYAVAEENASGGTIVTAPTCGSSGVVPATMLYASVQRNVDDDAIVRALITAGVIGNLVKTNASISGAECGCQAEIGTACSMASAALGELKGLDLSQIEYAAEISMEHHLGLTCDPVFGLVEIPCIERNAVAAMRAMNAVSLAEFLSETRKISFDLVVETMYETGKDLGVKYRETAEGGLAKLYAEEFQKRSV